MQEFLDKLLELKENDREIIFKNLTIVAQFGKRNFQRLVLETLRMSERELGKPLLVS